MLPVFPVDRIVHQGGLDRHHLRRDGFDHHLAWDGFDYRHVGAGQRTLFGDHGVGFHSVDTLCFDFVIDRNVDFADLVCHPARLGPAVDAGTRQRRGGAAGSRGQARLEARRRAGQSSPDEEQR